MRLGNRREPARGSDGAPDRTWSRLIRVFTVGIMAGLAAYGGCGRGQKGPSVLVIIVDTLRADHVGCYGYDQGATPNMDRLAAAGARFTECVASAPLTLPSISTILTSSYPIYHGVRDNGIFTLDESLTTMAEVFNNAGFATAAVVGAYVLDRDTGIDQGYEHFDCDFGDTYSRTSSLSPTRAREIGQTQRRAEEVTERAVQWLGTAHGAFFLTVHYYDPHSPYDPPSPFYEKYPQSRYLGEVAYTDSQLPPVLQAAEKAAGEAGLITVLVADHGEGLGQHEERHHGFFIYDSTMLVPFMVVYPGPVPPGQVVDGQVATVDLAPTVLDLAGLTIPDSWQGVSLARRIAARPLSGTSDRPSETEGAENPRPTYIETFRTRYSHGWSELTGVRYDGWKLVRAPKPELYDLKNDPAELNNLYSANEAMVERMQDVMDKCLARWRGPLDGIGPNRELDQSALDKLETLGYITPQRPQSTGPLPDPKDMIGKLNSHYDSKERLDAAQSLLSRGDLGGAERELRAAIELDPGNAVAIHDLGLVYWRRGETEQALPFLERAAKLDSTKIEPHHSLAAAYMNLGRYKDAASELRAATAIDPEDAETRLMYATALENAGDLSGALEQYHKCIELAPDQTLAYYRAAAVELRLGHKAPARKMLEEMLQMKPPAELDRQARKLLEETAGD
jgi:arylsulfatase A-like enzyme/Flp pilus assembly protein TadD